MAYLIAHIAISLVCAQLLGVLLGWLLWGYVARQRGKEILALRERVADMQLLTARITVAPEPRMAFSDLPERPSRQTTGALIEGDLPAPMAEGRSFFKEEPEEPEVKEVAAAPPIAPDLEAEVKEARLQYLQEQVRELEGLRDRLPMLQADLSDAIAGRKSAETRFQEAKNDFEVRSSGLLSQIRDFEEAAAEWDQVRDRLEQEKLASERDLAAVKATLRDLQNSQRPQTVEAVPMTPHASAVELADLRERYQRALKERDAVAVELEFWKQSDGERWSDPGRVAELEEAIRGRDAQLAEQAARVESLLWRVAELEPFAAEAPEKEETLRRQEEEIAGHMAMHAENGERIRSLQNHVIELQATTVPTEHFDRIIGEHQDEIRRQAQEHQQRIGELQQMLAIKDDEIAQHVAVRYSQAGMVSSLEARVTELEGATERVIALEKLLSERDSEIKELLAAHSELQTEMQSWRTHALELEPVAERTPKLEATIREQAAELQRLRDAIGDKDGQLTFLQERLSAISSRLMAHQHRLQQVEPLAARTPELEKQLEERERSARESIKSLEEQHYLELTRLKVNSAQRIRRFRQSLNGFKH